MAETPNEAENNSTDNAEAPSTGHVLRAMTDDGSFRVMTIECTDLVREATATQGAIGTPAFQLGEALVAAILIRETMAPTCRVQVLLRNKSDDLVVGDAFPEGRTRGLTRLQDEILGLNLGNGAYVQVTRTLPGRPPHQGVIEVPDSSVPFDQTLTDYFKQSEQVETFAAVAVRETDIGEIARATGYIVQLLPELTDPPLEAMRTRLEKLGPLIDLADKVDGSPQALLDALLDGESYTGLATSPVFYGCGCSIEKVRSAVAMLGKDELLEMIQAGESSRVNCDYCRTKFELTPTQLQELVDKIPD